MHNYLLLLILILKEAGLTYIYHLMKTKKFGDAARSVTGGGRGRVSDYQSFLESVVMFWALMKIQLGGRISFGSL